MGYDAAMPSPFIDASPAATAERAIRRLLMATLLLGMGGVTADLLLLDHIESATQWIPLALIALAFVLLAVHAFARRAATMRMLQVVFSLFIACGGLGAYLHFQGNAAFQLDIDPTLGTRELIWKALRAKAPPALAPLAFVQLGLVGLAWSFRHPILRIAQRKN